MRRAIGAGTAASWRSVAAMIGVVALLSGCGEGFPGLGGTQDADAPTEGGEAAGTSVDTDVEAPDVFAANETGLWDGRPSLGGVWVAHPDVTDPERVMIRNTSGGQSVVGALFRRERDNPGPRIQVSSDAADALGLLAGQPAELRVVALRRETVTTPAPDADPGDEPAGEIATAALPPAPGRASDPVARAGAAIDAAEITAATSGTQTAATAPAAQTPARPTTDTQSTLDKPYIQIGIFSVETNAQNTAQSLRTAGIDPVVRPQQSAGKRFWRVIVGPARTAGDRRAALAKVRDLGFSDAYYVTN